MRVRTQARREAIIDAAAQLFEEEGYENASMNELNKRLGGSKTTLYGYFPSKEELLVAVVTKFATAHMMDAITELTAALEQRAPLKTALLRFGDQALKPLANDTRAREIHRLVFAEAGRSNVGELFTAAGPNQLAQALAKVLGNAMANGEIREADPLLAAQQFIALLVTEVTGRSYQQAPPALKPAQIHQYVVRAVEFFLCAMVARRG